MEFSKTFDDIDVLVGNKEGSIIVDFNKLLESDKHNDSLFLVGGRLY